MDADELRIELAYAEDERRCLTEEVNRMRADQKRGVSHAVVRFSRSQLVAHLATTIYAGAMSNPNPEITYTIDGVVRLARNIIEEVQHQEDLSAPSIEVDQ